MFDNVDALLGRTYLALNSHAARYKRLYTGMALSVLIAGLIISFSSSDVPISDLNALWLLINLLMTAPAAIALTALSLRYSARMAGVDLPFFQAFKACCIGTATNVLPIPAGTLVHVSALIGRGASVLRSNFIIVVSNLLPLGWILLFAGTVLLIRWITSGLIIFLCGAAILVLGISLLRPSVDSSILLRLIAITIARSFFLVGRILISFMAVGLSIRIADATLFSAAASAGSLVVIAPSGLGVSESLAAILSLATQVSPARAFVAVAVNTLTALIFASLCTAGFLMIDTKKDAK